MDSGIQLPHKDLNITAIWMSLAVNGINREWSINCMPHQQTNT